MNEISNWSDLFMNSMYSFGQKAMDTLPSIFGVICIFLVGWIIAKVVSFVITKVLKIAKFDVLAEKVKITEYLEKAKSTKTPSEIVGVCIYYLLMLLVFLNPSPRFTLSVHRVNWSSRIAQCMGVGVVAPVAEETVSSSLALLTRRAPRHSVNHHRCRLS